MALDTVGDYITTARTLLNDTDADTYRYTNALMIEAVQAGVDDMRRIRPDLFLADMGGLGTVIADKDTDLQIVDRQYRSALLYYIVGFCEYADDEAADKARAASFTALFATKLTGAQA